MTENNGRKWVYGDERRDPPERRYHNRATYHPGDTEKAKEEGELELLDEFGDLLEEGCVFDLLIVTISQCPTNTSGRRDSLLLRLRPMSC